MSSSLVSMKMGMPFSISKHARTGFAFKKDHRFIIQSKAKVAVVLGTTGTGKSRLSIDLGTLFDGEVINSDKIQVYKGLQVIANNVTEEERRGVPHHLLGIIDPDVDFTAEDFVYHATLAAEAITENGRLPIIAGGSNSFVKALLNEDTEFRSKYECCYLWVNVEMLVLNSFLSKRVDKMVERGLVEEAREFFEPSGDYTYGIRRSIGVPEMDEFFRNESFVDGETRARLLKAAIDEIKENTFKLASRQLQNILRLAELEERPVHRLDATEAFLRRGVGADKAWERFVLGPSIRILGRFLSDKDNDLESALKC